MTQDDIDRMTALPRLFEDVRWEIIGEFKAADRASPSGAARYLVNWIARANLDSSQMQRFLGYLLWSSSSGRGSLEEAAQIASKVPDVGDAIRAAVRKQEGLKPVKKHESVKIFRDLIQKADEVRTTPKPRECLRKIKDGVVCPYTVDVRSNTITYKKGKDRFYRIPRGDASHVVNALVRGMLNGIRKKRSWLVNFTRREEKILHRSGDGTRFYKECVVRAKLDGVGNQKFGGTAQLRE